ncbi:hypothetical protein D3C72_2448310 [compost metagenome]
MTKVQLGIGWYPLAQLAFDIQLRGLIIGRFIFHQLGSGGIEDLDALFQSG